MRNARMVARLIMHKLWSDLTRSDEWNVSTYRSTMGV